MGGDGLFARRGDRVASSGRGGGGASSTEDRHKDPHTGLWVLPKV
jgi:hypothetical protein